MHLHIHTVCSVCSVHTVHTRAIAAEVLLMMRRHGGRVLPPAAAVLGWAGARLRDQGGGLLLLRCHQHARREEVPGDTFHIDTVDQPPLYSTLIWWWRLCSPLSWSSTGLARAWPGTGGWGRAAGAGPRAAPWCGWAAWARWGWSPAVPGDL